MASTSPGAGADRVRFHDRDHGDTRYPGSVLIVTNGSRRPIRDITCRIEGAPPDGEALKPGHLGAVERMSDSTGRWDYVPHNPRALSTFPLIRPGFAYGFIFTDFVIPADDATNPASRTAQPIAQFTDDADLPWQIDGDLRLAQQPVQHKRWSGLIPRNQD